MSVVGQPLEAGGAGAAEGIIVGDAAGEDIIFTIDVGQVVAVTVTVEAAAAAGQLVAIIAGVMVVAA